MRAGDICYLENIIFENNGKKHLDQHSLFTGRPCVFVGETDEKMYFFPIIDFDDKFKGNIIEKTPENRLKKKSVIDAATIIEKPIAYYEKRGYISTKEMLQLYRNILYYYRKAEDGKKLIIRDMAQEEVSKSSRRRHEHQ